MEDPHLSRLDLNLDPLQADYRKSDCLSGPTLGLYDQVGAHAPEGYACLRV